MAIFFVTGMVGLFSAAISGTMGSSQSGIITDSFSRKLVRLSSANRERSMASATASIFGVEVANGPRFGVDLAGDLLGITTSDFTVCNLFTSTLSGFCRHFL